jgi:hypothetical protein
MPIEIKAVFPGTSEAGSTPNAPTGDQWENYTNRQAYDWGNRNVENFNAPDGKYVYDGRRWVLDLTR